MQYIKIKVNPFGYDAIYFSVIIVLVFLLY